jgi:hypothetical protein
MIKLATAPMIIMAVAFPLSAGNATTVNINATSEFMGAIMLSGADMEFSDVVFSAVPTVAGDFVKLGTNGAATYGGVFSAGAGASTVAGDVTVTSGIDGEVVEVRCDMTATMVNGAASVQVTGIEVEAEDTTAAYGAGSLCNGVGGAVATTLILNLGTLDSFKFGGMVDGSTAVNWAAGNFSTVGGDDVQVDVAYQ